MTVGERVARAIVWNHQYGKNRKPAKTYEPFTETEVALISAKGTLADYCGSLCESLTTASGIRRRNIRLIYNLPTIISVYNKACEEADSKMRSPIDDFKLYQWMCDSMVRNGIVTKDCKSLTFSDDQIAAVADDIYIDILPVTVEMVADKVLDLQDGRISEVVYDKNLIFKGTV